VPRSSLPRVGLATSRLDGWTRAERSGAERASRPIDRRKDREPVPLRQAPRRRPTGGVQGWSAWPVGWDIQRRVSSGTRTCPPQSHRFFRSASILGALKCRSRRHFGAGVNVARGLEGTAEPWRHRHPASVPRSDWRSAGSGLADHGRADTEENIRRPIELRGEMDKD